MGKWSLVKLGAIASFLVYSFFCLPQSSRANQNATPSPSAAEAAFQRLKSLSGTWEAPLHGTQEGKVMVDTFSVIAEGSAVLAAEWLDGKQLTTTVFYMVGPELRADHYCDYENQPRYVARPSADGSLVEFIFRDATNLDIHPRHFHATTWRFLDAGHLTQDWEVAEVGKKSKSLRMEFTRK